MERIRRASGIAWRNVGGETIIVHLSHKRMYGLNASGGRIWEALATPASFEELQQLLLLEAGHESEARAGLEAFLADLHGEGLIETGAPLSLEADGGSRPAAPRIEWREEIRRFAGASCAKFPGVSAVCDQNPQS